MQTKTLDFALDIKALDDSEGIVEGWASTYSVDQGGDRVMKDAFKDSLGKARREDRRITMNWNHNPDEPIGLWEHISEEAKGLFVRGRLLKDAVRRAGEVYALLKAGAINGLSIGYRIPPGGAEHDKKTGVTLLKTIDLREISLVGMPMNVEARVVSVKTMLEAGQMPSLREFEDFLRESGGFSKSLATAITCKAAPILRGEPDEKAIEPVDFFEALSRKLNIG